MSCWMTQAAAATNPQPDSVLRVEVASGRHFVGAVDRQTDAECLYLRSVQGVMQVVRPIEWRRIVRAEIAGMSLSAEQLRNEVQEVQRRLPPAPASTPRAAPGPVAMPASANRQAVPQVLPKNIPSADRHVRSLALEATLANWDADVESDGLVVRIYPLDDQGQVVPVDGSLELELVAPRSGPRSDPSPPVQIGRWVRRTRPDDFQASGPFADGARYRLEFQAIHPEFDRQVTAGGLLHARLSVPGQGTFEATTSTVRIRPYSAARDWLEQATGRRFLPSERLGQ